MNHEVPRNRLITYREADAWELHQHLLELDSPLEDLPTELTVPELESLAITVHMAVDDHTRFASLRKVGYEAATQAVFAIGMLAVPRADSTTVNSAGEVLIDRGIGGISRGFILAQYDASRNGD